MTHSYGVIKEEVARATAEPKADVVAGEEWLDNNGYGGKGSQSDCVAATRGFFEAAGCEVPNSGGGPAALAKDLKSAGFVEIDPRKQGYRPCDGIVIGNMPGRNPNHSGGGHNAVVVGVRSDGTPIIRSDYHENHATMDPRTGPYARAGAEYHVYRHRSLMEPNTAPTTAYAQNSDAKKGNAVVMGKRDRESDRKIRAVKMRRSGPQPSPFGGSDY